MNADDAAESRITAGWSHHGNAWIRAVREHRIPNRDTITDQALVDAILERRPGRLLDLGCGEGWLARRLAPHGIRVTGIDAAAPLVAAARSRGGGEFRVANYADLPTDLGLFDLAVSNFSLLGREAVDHLLAILPQHLMPHGALLIQTLHPLTVISGNGIYADGWREDSWAAFSEEVKDPPPWYFRTLASWVDLLGCRHWQLRQLREPMAKGAALPASLLLLAQPQ